MRWRWLSRRCVVSWNGTLHIASTNANGGVLPDPSADRTAPDFAPLENESDSSSAESTCDTAIGSHRAHVLIGLARTYPTQSFVDGARLIQAQGTLKGSYERELKRLRVAQAPLKQNTP